MKTLKTIYLTLIHAALAASVFLYTSDNYSLVRIEHEQSAKSECCQPDELTALIDKHLRGGK